MLFYNEHDEICVKDGDETRVIIDYDVVDVAGTYYSYINGYFYRAIDCGDGEFQTDYEKRTHPRHIDIVEKEEAFATPTRPLTKAIMYQQVRKKEKKTEIETLFLQMVRQIGSISEILVEESKRRYEPEEALELIRKTL